MAKKKQRSLLQMQQEKLRRQRAAKAQRQAANKQLPGRGRTSAGSAKARVQRGRRRDGMAKKQLTDFGRALKRTFRQGAAESKLKRAARGTRGSGVRTGQAAPGKLAKRGSSAITKKGAVVKSSSGRATDGRVERVKVSVDGQKKLRPGDTAKKVGSGSSTKGALKGKGGALAKRPKGGGLGAQAAATAGLYLADKMAQTIGKPGQSRMSKLGIKGPAKPVKKSKSTGPKVTGRASASEQRKRMAAARAGYPAAKPSQPSTKPAVRASKSASKPTSGKNPYRLPQGDERKDRMSKAVKELRAMQKQSKARQNAQMPKKPAKKKSMSRNERNRRRRQGRY